MATYVDALETHTAKRIADGEWKSTTSPEEYLQDVHCACASPNAQMWVGERQNERFLAVICPLPLAGNCSGKLLPGRNQVFFVVYNASQSYFSTAYLDPKSTAKHLLATWNVSRMVP